MDKVAQVGFRKEGQQLGYFDGGQLASGGCGNACDGGTDSRQRRYLISAVAGGIAQAAVAHGLSTMGSGHCSFNMEKNGTLI